jgi:chromosome segregation ATPase
LTTSKADEKLQALVKQKEELSRGLNSLLNTEDVDSIGAMYTKLATDINTALTAVDAVSEMYDKVRSLRKQIDSGRQEQITAQRRIANEMENLNRTSMRIVEELEYIKSEREKIRFRAATEFHPVPLPELLTVRGGDCNTAWRSLYDKGTVGQVYN